MNKNLLKYILICLCISNNVLAQDYPVVSTRDPLKWPFSSTSIWNQPIGSGAVYVPAKIEKAMSRGMTIDEDYVVMRPDAPLMDVYYSDAGWNSSKSRCVATGGYMVSLPIPQSFVVSPQTWDGTTPNAGIAVLMPDKRTIKQNQPFAHCSEGGNATTQFQFDNQDIYGEGYYGAHGASGLSAIGGALRVGELTPTSGPIRHAMKVNLYGKKNYYYDATTKGYRWPAKAADSYASTNYYTLRTNPVVPQCRVGALLALPASMNINNMGFETEPAKILAKAFQDYGAYIVDDAAWDVYAIITEWGPAGRFNDEFTRNWGFSMKQVSKDHAWSRDMDRIFLNLHVVDNNSSSSIGGGGTLRAPLAPVLPSENEHAHPDSIASGSWTILNWDVTKTSSWAEFPMMYNAYNSGTVSSSIASPTNASNKCFKWTKSGAYGYVKFYTSNIKKYIDFSRWDSIKFDVYIPTVNLTQVQINFLKHGADQYSTSKIESGKWYNLSNKPMGQWNTVTVPISAINYPVSNNLANAFCGVMIQINPSLTGPSDVYIDNLRLVKTISKLTTTVLNTTINKLKLIDHTASEEIVLSGAKGNVSIYNIFGAEVMRLNNYEGAAISTSKLTNGIYVVKTSAGSLKFVK